MGLCDSCIPHAFRETSVSSSTVNLFKISILYEFNEFWKLQQVVLDLNRCALETEFDFMTTHDVLMIDPKIISSMRWSYY